MKGQFDWMFGLIVSAFTLVGLATAYWSTHKSKTKKDLEAEVEELKKEVIETKKEVVDTKQQLAEAKDEIKINRRKINKIIERFIEKSSF